MSGVFFTVLMAFLFLYIFHILQQGSGGTVQIFLYFVQMSLLLIRDSNWLGWVCLFYLINFQASFLNFNFAAAINSSSCTVPLNELET